jgi:predicted DNA-binding WGR domain protein
MYQRWESPTRYYVIHVDVDLLGDMTLRRVWGGIGSPRGGQKTECPTPGQVDARVEELARERRRRGYVRVL